RCIAEPSRAQRPLGPSAKGCPVNTPPLAHIVLLSFQPQVKPDGTRTTGHATGGREPGGFSNRKDRTMLYWAIVFLVIALIAAALGFGGIAGAASGIAQVLFVVFLAIFVISLFIGIGRRGPVA